jgi:hypothetical protein
MVAVLRSELDRLRTLGELRGIQIAPHLRRGLIHPSNRIA